MSVCANLHEFVTCAEHVVHLILQTATDIIERSDRLIILARSGICVGSWISVGALVTMLAEAKSIGESDYLTG